MTTAGSFPVGSIHESAEDFARRLQAARPRKVVQLPRRGQRTIYRIEMRTSTIEVWDGPVGPRARYARSL